MLATEPTYCKILLATTEPKSETEPIQPSSLPATKLMQDAIAQDTGREVDFKNSYVEVYEFRFHQALLDTKNIRFYFIILPEHFINHIGRENDQSFYIYFLYFE